jgi:hypothetical protein
MLLNYHEITGRPQDRLVAFDLWYVTEVIPPPGAPRQPATRRKLISHGNVDAPPGAPPEAAATVPGGPQPPRFPRVPSPQPMLRPQRGQSIPPR